MIRILALIVAIPMILLGLFISGCALRVLSMGLDRGIPRQSVDGLVVGAVFFLVGCAVILSACVLVRISRGEPKRPVTDNPDIPA